MNVAVLNALLILALLQAPPPTLPQVGNAVIEGIVKRLNSSELIPDAEIELTSVRQGVSTTLKATADAAGHFTIKGLVPGSYSLFAKAPGYVRIEGMATTILSTDSPQEISVSMTAMGRVSGVLDDPYGQPLSGVQVCALRGAFVFNGSVAQPGQCAYTDHRGAYEWWLEPGTYFVGADLQRAAYAEQRQIPSTWVLTYFPGVADASSAIPVEVASGARVQGVDFSLQAIATHTISGRVINQIPNPKRLSNGQPDSAVTSIYVVPHGRKVDVDDGIVEFPNSIPAARQREGEFEIRGVRPGIYDLYPVVQGDPESLDNQTVSKVMIFGGGNNNYTGRTTVTVSDGNVESVVIPVGHGVDLKIRATRDGSTPENRGDGTFSNLVLLPRENLPGDISDSVRFSQYIGIDPQALLTLPNVPEGTYDISRLVKPAGYYVADLRQAGKSVLESGITVSRDGPDTVEVILKPGGGTVQGTVRRKGGDPALGAYVVLVPQPPRRSAVLLYRTVEAEPAGTFSMKDVTPGEYKLFAWDKLAPYSHFEYLNPDFLTPFEEQGKVITVLENGAVTTQLDLLENNSDRKLKNSSAPSTPSTPAPIPLSIIDLRTANGGNVAGVITRSDTSIPLVSIAVTLNAQMLQDSAVTVFTDAAGRFEFQNVPAGEYSVTAQRDGYFGSLGPDLEVLRKVTASVTIAAGQRIEGVALSLVPAGGIRGRILGPNGMPFFNAIQVTPLRARYIQGQRTLSVLDSGMSFPESRNYTVYADDSGEFHLSPLPPGEYYVAAYLALSDSRKDMPPKMYFPGVTSPSAAASVIVPPGGDAVADFNFRSVTSYNVSGKVSSIDGSPIRSGNFVLTPVGVEAVDDNRPINFFNRDDRVATGLFKIQGVLPGIYNIEGGGGSGIATVANSDLEGLTLVAGRPRGSLRVRVNVEGAGVVRSITPQLRIRSANPSLMRTVRNLKPTSDSDGAFTFKEMVEGQYDVWIGEFPNPGMYISDVRLGGSSAFDAGIVVTGSTPDITDVTVRSDGGAISGVVTNADGKAAAQATVALVPIRERRQNLSLFKSAPTDTHGRFDLRGIAPGDYALFAWGKVEPGAWENEEFLSKFEDQGAAITIVPNAQTSVPLRLIP